VPVDGLHHVGIAVDDLERAVETYRRLFGAEVEHRETVADQGADVALLRVGDGRIELLAAHGPSTPVGKFLAERGAGMHHLAFEAPSRGVVDERARWLRSQAAEIESGPQEYAYSLGYYAVFFYDPDGLKLEIVHVPRHAA